MSNRFLVSGVFILILILGVGAVSGLSEDPKVSVDKSIKSDGLYINITGKSVSRIDFTVPKGWKSIDHVDDGGKYTRNKYINRDVNSESLDVSWIWVNDQSMVKVSNTLVPTDRAGDKSINIEAMNYGGSSSKTVKINSFEVEKDENNSIRNNSRQFGEVVRKIIYEQEVDTSDIAGLDILKMIL